MPCNKTQINTLQLWDATSLPVGKYRTIYSNARHSRHYLFKLHEDLHSGNLIMNHTQETWVEAHYMIKLDLKRLSHS